MDQAKSARIARDSEEPVDPDPVPVEVDYTAEGEVTEISPDTVTFAENKFTVPADVKEFTFKDGDKEMKATFADDEWKFEDITEDPKVARVSSVEELQEALNNNDIETIELEDNIKADLDIKRSVVIDGLNKTLEGKIIIYSDYVTLKNLTVDLNMDKPTEWQSGSYAVQVYKATNAVLENVTLTNANAGLLVNGGEVEVENVESIGNGFGGIEVSQGENVDTVPKLTVNGLTHYNAETPAIWIDGKTTNDGWVVGEGFEEMTVPEGENQVWFKVN